MELRGHQGGVTLESRSEGLPKISGYAAVFYRAGERGTEYELGPGMVERIGRSAFDRAIAEDDVRGLFNHDSGMILGRAKSGTLKLSVDEIGLRYEITPPDTQAARDIVESIRRGDVSGSSFAFQAITSDWERSDDAAKTDVRTLTDVRLYDVGPVTFPAYSATETQVRAALAEHDQWLEQYEAERRQAELRRRSVTVRRRVLDLHREIA